MSPLTDDDARLHLLQANPLAKIPTMILPSGETLYDSRVICEYLVSLPEAPPHLVIHQGDEFGVKRRMALADGILDAAFNLVMELRRPVVHQSDEWQTRWEENIRRTIPVLSEETLPAEKFDLGSIGALCVVDYLDFRLPDLDLISNRLRGWRSQHRDRESVTKTMPSDF